MSGRRASLTWFGVSRVGLTGSRVGPGTGCLPERGPTSSQTGAKGPPVEPHFRSAQDCPGRVRREEGAATPAHPAAGRRAEGRRDPEAAPGPAGPRGPRRTARARRGAVGGPEAPPAWWQGARGGEPALGRQRRREPGPIAGRPSGAERGAVGRGGGARAGGEAEPERRRAAEAGLAEAHARCPGRGGRAREGATRAAGAAASRASPGLRGFVAGRLGSRCGETRERAAERRGAGLAQHPARAPRRAPPAAAVVVVEGLKGEAQEPDAVRREPERPEAQDPGGRGGVPAVRPVRREAPASWFLRAEAGRASVRGGEGPHSPATGVANRRPRRVDRNRVPAADGAC